MTSPPGSGNQVRVILRKILFYALTASSVALAQDDEPLVVTPPVPSDAQTVAPPAPTPEPTAAAGPSWRDYVAFSFQYRLRGEGRDNQDLDPNEGDLSSFILQRIRLGIDLRPIDHWRVFLQPQHSGAWGQLDGVPNGGSGVAGGVPTSGGTQDRAIMLHQGYVETDRWRPFVVRIGRQELNYGDGVVIGNLDFSNVARSFDAALLHYGHDRAFVDAFFSQTAENDANRAVVDGQAIFAGVYAGSKFLRDALQADVYALWLLDQRLEDFNDFNIATLGHRNRFNFAGFDTRFEGGMQIGKSLEEDTRAYMYDFEAGYTLPLPGEIRLGGEYLYASGDTPFEGKFSRWHPLFPSPHPYLGYLDLFGRQNIRAIKGQIGFAPNPRWDAHAAYHRFRRANGADVAYTINAESPIANQLDPVLLLENSKDLGQEVDLTLNYRPLPYLDLQLQGGVFFPGDYVKESIGDAIASYAHLQATLKFQ